MVNSFINQVRMKLLLALCCLVGSQIHTMFHSFSTYIVITVDPAFFSCALLLFKIRIGACAEPTYTNHKESLMNLWFRIAFLLLVNYVFNFL